MKVPRVLDSRRGLTLVVLLTIAGALAVRRFGAGTGPLEEFSGPTMGSLYHVSVDADLSDGERERIRGVIEQRLARVDGLMSTFDSASEISRFNRHASTEPFVVSDEVLEVLALALDVSERTGGALDVTVAPLVDAWGFGPEVSMDARPDSARVAELLALVDYRALVLDPVQRTVTKMNPAIRVDLSAIAQGYAADAVVTDLAALGLTSFLVEISGELKAVGTRRDGRAWRVGIELPDPAVSAVWGTVDLRDEGISTSGDYRSWFEVGGVRYAHLIDPRTGEARRMVGASVSVVHESVAVADAWDTALAVLGADEGYDVAVREGLAALFLTRAGDGFDARVTPAMADRGVPARPAS